jgi:hypothetical protein
MFYQPDRKMTIVVLTNYHGANAYKVAKALYEALPGFLCGNDNKKETKIKVCFKGESICIDRKAADEFIKRGAYLGECDQQLSVPHELQSVNLERKVPESILVHASPNPFTSQVTISFKVSESGPVTLRLYDLSGRLVADIFNGIGEKGYTKQFTFHAGKLPAGIYVARVQGVGTVKEQKIVLRR